MKALGPLRPAPGPSTSTGADCCSGRPPASITEVVPERKLAFRVNENNTVWTYELEPTATGTRLIESRHAENGVKAVSNLLVEHVHGRRAELRATNWSRG